MGDLNLAYSTQRTNTDGAFGAAKGTIFFCFPIVDWLESKESLEAIAEQIFFGRLPTHSINTREWHRKGGYFQAAFALDQLSSFVEAFKQINWLSWFMMPCSAMLHTSQGS